MRVYKKFFKSIPITALLFTGFVAGGIAQDTNTKLNPEAKAPVILTTTPTGDDVNVDPGSVIEITFSSDMDESTINGTTLLLHATTEDSMHEMQKMHEMHGKMPDDQRNDMSAIKDSVNSRQVTRGAVNGTISYSNNVAVFTPDMALKEDAMYTFTVTNGVNSLESIALENDHNWSFTTTETSDSTYSDKQNVKYGMDKNEHSENTINGMLKGKLDMIDLGKADQFVILAKTDINNESESRITGHTGEGSVADSIKKEQDDSDSVRQTTSGQAAVLQSKQSDTTSPDVNEAIEDMLFAYSDASVQNGDGSTSHMNELFHGTVLNSGIHEWSDSLHIVSDVTLSGGEDDVWLFKVNDNLVIDDNIVFTLINGARADNVFWYVEGKVIIGKNTQFEGIILSMNEITLEKGAKLNGRMFSQTSINLDDNTVAEPRSIAGRTTSSNR